MIGWITLHRKIEENELWLSEPFSKGQAWVDLIMIANHKDNVLWKRGIRVVVKRGEVGWSEVALSKRWQWSREKVRNFLKYLKTVQQIERESNHTLSRIIIKNYNKYQLNQTTDQTTDQTVNNNVNNVNNNLGDKSPEKDMSWKKTSDECTDAVVDYDGDGGVTNLEEETKVKDRKEREDIKYNLRLIEEPRGLTYNPAALNADVKVYQQLLKYGWTHDGIIGEYLNTIDDPYWKDEKLKGKYPTLKTVEFRVRNKQPS